MIDRRTFIGTMAGSALITAARAVDAQQQPAKIYRIGFLGITSASEFASRVEALRAGLRDLGYIEGRNIVIEFRWAEENYDRLPELAADLVRLKVDVLVTHSNAGASAAKQATTTIPIVMAVGADAVATGLVENLARPGGNLTGSTILLPEISGKRLALLKEAVPRIARLAVLVRDSPGNRSLLQPTETTARSLNVTVQLFNVRGPNEFESAFSAMSARRVDAVAVFDDPLLIVNAAEIADLAARQRLPSTGSVELAEAGGLIGYGVDAPELFRHAAVFVDRILRGAKPRDLPIEQATKFHLLVNLKAAKVLGITIPQSLLVRADEVIQ
jgi:putative ABC transport system substrate-binding protein